MIRVAVSVVVSGFSIGIIGWGLLLVVTEGLVHGLLVSIGVLMFLASTLGIPQVRKRYETVLGTQITDAAASGFWTVAGLFCAVLVLLYIVLAS